MKLFTGWVMSAGLVLAAAAANAQGVGPGEAGRLPTTAVSDFGGPYAAMPPGAPVPSMAKHRRAGTSTNRTTPAFGRPAMKVARLDMRGSGAHGEAVELTVSRPRQRLLSLDPYTHI